MPAQGNTTVVAKPLAAAGAGSSRHKDDLWLRAAMLTPSFSSYMTATRIGASDMRSIAGATAQAVNVGRNDLLDRPPAGPGGYALWRPGGGLRGHDDVRDAIGRGRIPVAYDGVAALIL